MSLLAACAFAPICSPEVPGTPFGGFWISVFDVARLVCAGVALATLAFTPKAYSVLVTRGQRARVIALTLLTLQAIVTEIEHLGDYASLRLVLNLGAVLYGLYGVIQLPCELPAVKKPLGKKPQS